MERKRQAISGRTIFAGILAAGLLPGMAAARVDNPPDIYPPLPAGVFDRREDFQSRLRHSKTYTFEVADGFPEGIATIDTIDGQDVTLSGMATLLPAPDASSRNQYLVGSISVRFRDPQDALGLDLVRKSGQGVWELRVEYGSGEVIETTHAWSRPSDFIGFIPTAPIVGFTFWWEDPLADAPYPLGGIDNLTVGTVPEPSTTCFIGIGSVLALAARRRAARAS
jgi:hypothetical protein